MFGYRLEKRNEIMERVCIVGGLRSYIGVEQGMYKRVSAEQLGAHVLHDLQLKYPFIQQDLDGVILGNAVGGGGNLARLTMLEASFSEKIAAHTIDSQCGSGLEAIASAAARIECGLANVMIAGGIESCSTNPTRVRNENHPDYRQGEDNRYRVAKFEPNLIDELAMLRGAENTAQSFRMCREKLDYYAYESHKRAAYAQSNRELQDILAVPYCSCDKDEGIRPSISRKLLARLPALVPGGEFITAGNACLTHDGAAFLILCSTEYAQKNHIQVCAKIEDYVTVGATASRSPESVIAAVHSLLERNQLQVGQIAAWECNEAFAVLDVLMEEQLGVDHNRLNIFGGALAYGHPYGASGGIITLHLLKAMQRLTKPETVEKKYGVATIAAAGGIGSALLIS